MRSPHSKRRTELRRIIGLWPFGALAVVLVAMQGCVVSSGLYYLPSADVPAGVTKKVRKAPCALPLGGPYAIFLMYPGLTISASASGSLYVPSMPGPMDVDSDLSLRLAVSENHSVVTALSDINLGGMSGNRYYTANIPAGQVTSNGQISGGSGGTYTVLISNTGAAPPEFQIVVPSLLLDGREIGPVTITFTRHSGIWTQPLSC